jgi:hypothetical protein
MSTTSRRGRPESVAAPSSGARVTVTGAATSAGAAPPSMAASARAAASDLLETLATDWGALLGLVAFACWFLGHLPALAWVFIPAWVITGLAVGAIRPWYGLLLTIIVVPFLGGATEQQFGEILRVVPIYGAAVRVLVDRFIVAPSYGRPASHEPPWWVVLCAILAAGLYALTALTASLAVGRDDSYLQAGVMWLVGGAIAMMAAWVVASHVIAGRERAFGLVVLVVTVVACVAALGAWLGLPGLDLITFPGHVEGGRLGALGYPTPTAMGLATVLPIAAWAAYGIRRWLLAGVVVLILVTMVLTWSRGPLIAVGVGAALAALASGRVDRRIAIAGIAAGAVAFAGLVAFRYGTNPDSILSTIASSLGGDSDRVRTWVAAVTITVSSPLLGGGYDALARVGDFASLRIANSHDMLLDAFASGGVPLGVTNAVVVLYSAWRTWVGRKTMALWLIAAVATFLVCGLWDIPQVRSYAAVMGGLVLGMAAGPLIGRSQGGTGTPE